MDAIRELVYVKDRTVTIKLPENFQARRVEVIVLEADEPMPAAAPERQIKRRPSPRLAGTTIVGDIMSPVVDADDWDALR